MADVNDRSDNTVGINHQNGRERQINTN